MSHLTVKMLFAERKLDFYETLAVADEIKYKLKVTYCTFNTLMYEDYMKLQLLYTSMSVKQKKTTKKKQKIEFHYSSDFASILPHS